jgi:hypothetical protein
MWETEDARPESRIPNHVAQELTAAITWAYLAAGPPEIWLASAG